MVESGPSELMTKYGGIHPPDIGKRMKEIANHKIIQEISADSLRTIIKAC